MSGLTFVLQYPAKSASPMSFLMTTLPSGYTSRISREVINSWSGYRHSFPRTFILNSTSGWKRISAKSTSPLSLDDIYALQIVKNEVGPVLEWHDANMIFRDWRSRPWLVISVGWCEIREEIFEYGIAECCRAQVWLVSWRMVRGSQLHLNIIYMGWSA